MRNIIIIFFLFFINYNKVKDISFNDLTTLRENNNKPILILFYLENNETTRSYENELNQVSEFFIKTESYLKNNVSYYKINCNNNINIENCKTLVLKETEYPKIYFFKKNNKKKFNLKWCNTGNIIKFLFKFLNIIYMDIEKLDDLYLIMSYYKNLFILYGENEQNMDYINNVNNNLKFYLKPIIIVKIKNEDILNYLNIKEEDLYLYIITLKKIIKVDKGIKMDRFLVDNNYDEMKEFLWSWLNVLIANQKTFILYFYNKKPDFEEDLLRINDNKILKYKLDINSVTGVNLKNYFGLLEDNGIFIFKTEKKLIKYKYPFEEFKEDLVKNFFDDFHNNKLDIFYKSERIVNDDKYPKQLVGLNYEEEVFGNNDTILIMFYADFCEISKKVLEFYEELSKIYTNIKFTKINGEKNENKSIIKYSGYPSLVIYKFNKKENKKNLFIFGEKREKENIIKFLEIHNKIEKEVLNKEL